MKQNQKIRQRFEDSPLVCGHLLYHVLEHVSWIICKYRGSNLPSFCNFVNLDLLVYKLLRFPISVYSLTFTTFYVYFYLRLFYHTIKSLFLQRSAWVNSVEIMFCESSLIVNSLIFNSCFPFGDLELGLYPCIYWFSFSSELFGHSTATTGRLILNQPPSHAPRNFTSLNRCLSKS